LQNTLGQLGLGHNNPSPNFIERVKLNQNVNYNVKSIAAGRYQSFVWSTHPTTLANVFTSWGGDLVGDGSLLVRYSPKNIEIGHLQSIVKNYTAITSGYGTQYIHTPDSIFGFGDNAFKQLNSATPNSEVIAKFVLNYTLSQIDCSRKCYGITPEGKLISWGTIEEDYAASAQNGKIKFANIPNVKIDKFNFVHSNMQTLYLNSSTEGFHSMGLNTQAQLGDGTFTSRNAFTKLDMSRLHTHDSITMFDATYHALAVTQENDLVGWGSNERKELDPTSPYFFLTVPMILNFNKGKIKAVSVGYYSSLVIMENNMIYCMGA